MLICLLWFWPRSEETIPQPAADCSGAVEWGDYTLVEGALLCALTLQVAAAAIATAGCRCCVPLGAGAAAGCRCCGAWELRCWWLARLQGAAAVCVCVLVIGIVYGVDVMFSGAL